MYIFFTIINIKNVKQSTVYKALYKNKPNLRVNEKK
jgi:hypothetical protein